MSRILTGDKLATYKKEQALLDVPKKPVVEVKEIELPKIDETIKKGVPEVKISSVPTKPEQKSFGQKVIDYGKEQLESIHTALKELLKVDDLDKFLETIRSKNIDKELKRRLRGQSK